MRGSRALQHSRGACSRSEIWQEEITSRALCPRSTSARASMPHVSGTSHKLPQLMAHHMTSNTHSLHLLMAPETPSF
eukprot:6476030-Prymnesium_polylepis.1